MKWETYKKQVQDALDSFQFDDEILDILHRSAENGQKIFVGGNGGSAAISIHYVCDLSKGATQNWADNFKRYQAICLSSNLGYITAIANDANYHEVFKQQLINLASPKDILVLISSSGNSPNVLQALDYANSIGMITIGITGFDGGKLKQHAKFTAHVNTNSYEVCEDVHSVFGHFLATYLRSKGNCMQKQTAAPVTESG